MNVFVRKLLKSAGMRANADILIDAAERDGIALDLNAIKARSIANGHTVEQAELHAALVMERLRQRAKRK